VQPRPATSRGAPMVVRQDRRSARLTALFAGAMLALLATAAGARDRHLEPYDEMIPALDPGIDLHLRSKYVQVSTVVVGRPVLFVHGATFPSSSTFDVALA